MLAGVLVDDVDGRLSTRGQLGQRQLEDAAFHRRLRFRFDRVRGQRKFDIEKERPVLLEVTIVLVGVFFAVSLDRDAAVLDRQGERVGGNTGDVEDEQIGVLALEKVEENVLGEIP